MLLSKEYSQNGRIAPILLELTAFDQRLQFIQSTERPALWPMNNNSFK